MIIWSTLDFFNPFFVQQRNYLHYIIRVCAVVVDEVEWGVEWSGG